MKILLIVVDACSISMQNVGGCIELLIMCYILACMQDCQTSISLLHLNNQSLGDLTPLNVSYQMLTKTFLSAYSG